MLQIKYRQTKNPRFLRYDIKQFGAFLLNEKVFFEKKKTNRGKCLTISKKYFKYYGTEILHLLKYYVRNSEHLINQKKKNVFTIKKHILVKLILVASSVQSEPT